jgi:WD40 repeat protein/energy-coupling factor transporter ATP-binding protein EcfA2
MSEYLMSGIVKINKGTGFVASSKDGSAKDDLIVTCAHVIGEPFPEKVIVTFLATNEQREALVVPEWGRSQKAEDIAILRVVGGLPKGVQPLPLGSSSGINGHNVTSYGFPSGMSVRPVVSAPGYGTAIEPKAKTTAGQSLIPIRSNEITTGFSGAPVWDELRRRVIGIVVMVARPDESGRMSEAAFATPVETLQQVCPVLKITSECPYRGLDVFTINDAEFFFGRQRVITELVERLRKENRCLAVLGPSGCGKSSVVQAGLIPQLRQGVLNQSDRWHIIVTRPFDDPFKQLATYGLVTASYDLTEGVGAWLARNPGQARLVLVFDQFEELFVTCSESVCQDFVTQLTRLIAGSLPITVILTVRDDFYSRLAQHELLMKLLMQSLVNVPPTLAHDELIDIVCKPAERVGMQFQENLVETIVKDAMETSAPTQARGRVADNTVLPLLEFALTQLWERPEDGMLTHKAYQTIGGVTGGLEIWGDKAYTELADDEKRRLAQRIFTDLVYLGNEREGIPNIRQRRPLSSLWRNAGEQENVKQVVRQLVDARLLVTSRSNTSNEEAVEIIHDALLREWERLRHWLEDNRSFLEWHQKLQDRLQDWIKTAPADAARREKDALLRGSELSDAEKWLKDRAMDMNQEERDFIQTSQQHIHEEEQYLHHLLEESQQRRIEAEQQREEAKRQQQLAVQEREEAKRQQQLAVQEREEAKRQQQLAEQQKQVALARQLVAQADLLRSQQANLLQRSVLLAVEAMQRSPSPEANQALRQGLALLPRPIARRLTIEDVKVAVLSPHGLYLLTINKYATAEVWDVMSGQLVVRLNHGAEVTMGAFSFDGRCVVTVGTDNSAKVWEILSGSQLVRLINEDDIKDVIVSYSGRFVAIINSDGRARIYEWDQQSKRQLNQLTDRDIVNAVAFSLDGRYYATASIDCNARVWEIASGQLLANLPHSRSINALSFSPDGRFLSTVSDDDSNYSSVRLWLWRAKSNIKPYQFMHESPINAVAFSPDRNYLATASKDQTACVWEIASSRPINRMRHEGSVNAVAFSPQGRYLATTSEDRTVGIWETSNGYRLICLPHKDVGFKERDLVHTVVFSEDGHSFTTASNNGQAAAWEIINNRLNHKKSVNMVAFRPDGNYLATASEDNTAAVWKVTNGWQRFQIDHEGKVWAVAFSRDGRFLATACRDGTARLVDMSDGRQLFRLKHNTNVNAVTFSPGGRYLASASEDKSARIWETSSGREIFSLPHEESVYSVDFSPKGDLLVTACGDGTARVWETHSGKQLFSLAHKPIINHVAFSPDGRFLATASWSRSAKLWEASSGRELMLLSHTNKVWYVAFSHDSKYLATASEDSTARVWDVSNGLELLRLPHESSVSAIAFSPDSQYLATASADRTARVWETATGNPLALLQHEDSVTAIAFSPDGKYLATASGEGIARLWIWQSKDLIAEACARLTRNLTDVEWRKYFGEENYRKTCPLL